MSVRVVASGHTASDFKGVEDLKGKTVVVFFYPKALTGGCTVESCGFRDLMKDKDFPKDVVILGGSGDDVVHGNGGIDQLYGDDGGDHSELFGINVFKVREVCEVIPITETPNMPVGVAGIVSLRGAILPVISLIFAAGVFTGILNGTHMTEALADSVVGAIPPARVPMAA